MRTDRPRNRCVGAIVVLHLTAIVMVAAGIPGAARAQQPATEAAVYEAVLNRFVGPETRRLVLLSDSTVRRRIRDRLLADLRSRGADVAPDLVRDFEQRNSVRWSLRDSLDLPVPLEILDRAAFLELQTTGDIDEWDWLRRRLPGSPGVVSLSRPGFSDDGDRALIQVTLMCGARCAEGSWVLLRRSAGGVWAIEHWITLLRS